MSALFIHLFGIISVAYLLNLGSGVIELLPDNIPIIGNLDEVSAVVILLTYLKYLGFDLLNIFNKNAPGKEE